MGLGKKLNDAEPNSLEDDMTYVALFILAIAAITMTAYLQTRDDLCRERARRKSSDITRIK